KAIKETLASIDGVMASFEEALTSINGVSVSNKEVSISIEEAFESIEEASVSIEEALVLIEESSKTPQRTKLISTIQKSPEEDLSSANNLISTMRYLKAQSLGAKVQHIKYQKSKHIAEIRSLVWYSKQITNEEFHEKVKTIFNPNKNFTHQILLGLLQIFYKLVKCCYVLLLNACDYSEFLVREPPKDWLSSSTLHTWHKDVSELQFNEQTYQVKNALAFGIIVDESTRGQLKILTLCYQYWDEKNQSPN
ncbi:10933_t:CDS:2, partial [Gigaspora margarita]